ncbi:MAG: DUF3604 domain-containing protein [Pseudomonadota bacterium]
MLRFVLIPLTLIVLMVAGGVFALRSAMDSLPLAVDAHDGLLLAPAQSPDFVARERSPCRDNYPSRKAHFGGLHIHTGLSGDAGAWGVTVQPADVYRFAQGEAIPVALRSDAPGESPAIRLPMPLDFAAVTDHAEYLGETSLCYDSDTEAYGSFLCSVYRGDTTLPLSADMQPLGRLASFAMVKQRVTAICGDDGRDCLERARDIWLSIQRAAEQAYDRSENCSFTSFVGYEYSRAVERSNLHRNVIFANGTVPPHALSSREATEPEQLWRWLETTCNRTDTGCQALAIPHNSNWSNGRMFYPYSLQDMPQEEREELAALRQRIEPLAEIMQVKGDSECRNGLARVIGLPDEYCDFEKLRHPGELAEDCGDGVGSGAMTLGGCMSRYSYVRYAQIEGLREEQLVASNSLKLGVIAATDTHIGAPGAVAEDAFPGSTGLDRTPRGQLRDPTSIPGLAKADITRYNPGGLAGVWAEENSRESLFAAMQRRETFGTSGPRIEPRLFGGWNLDPSLCGSPDIIEKAYEQGVPMGADLPAAPESAQGPTFLVTARMDPDETATPLQKIELIKGWIDEEGDMHQQVLTVAGDEETLGSVDTATCERSGAGHRQLCGLWQDPAFNPASSAVYYARVIENPSCRWTTHQCNRLPVDERPLVCASVSLDQTVQERAWTSPIFYSAVADKP